MNSYTVADYEYDSLDDDNDGEYMDLPPLNGINWATDRSLDVSVTDSNDLEPPRVRTEFPETWLWTDFMIARYLMFFEADPFFSQFYL